MLRDVGEFLSLACLSVDTCYYSYQGGPPSGFDAVITCLTPLEDLNTLFPQQRELRSNTPYGFYATTQNPDAHVIVVIPHPSLRERVVIEAALGMMDNPVFR